MALQLKSNEIETGATAGANTDVPINKKLAIFNKQHLEFELVLCLIFPSLIVLHSDWIAYQSEFSEATCRAVKSNLRFARVFQ